RYDLKHGIHIVSIANGKQTDVKAGEAIYERTAQKLALTGGAEIVQGNDHLKGDVLHASLFGDQKIRSAVIRGNASLRQVATDRTMKIAAPELNAEFGETRQLRDANAVGPSIVEIIPKESKEYTSVVTTAARGIGLVFKGEGLLENLKTDGRTTIQLNAPAGAPDAANKRLTADAVTTKFGPNGKDIQKAEAVGDAELYVEPLVADAKNYRTTINAPRFDCEFFPTGNNAKSCVAGRKAKATRVPTITAPNRGTQLISADQLVALFSPTSNDIDTLEANTNAKFTERDLNGLAGKMTFTKADEYIRLRSGEPTVWDSRGRAKAGEIDLDTRNDRTSLRGGVSTTYYSQRQIKDATPFASGRPVYFTADSAEFDHAAQTATYTGNARGWQENNYVRGNQLFIDQTAGRFTANGGVQSLIHNANLKMKGKDSLVPTSASADSMAYDRNNNILQYRSNVDIRLGSDRITAGLANLYLDEKNELSKTVVENNVVITQTNRRASGDWAQYSADDDVAILRGSPAVVTDPENGSTQSGQVTFSMRDNRITVETKSRQTSQGRTRSVYKIKELQP
ncbi:MAG: LptA/OstA family protein, partial [Pyrinomonadaceae bacterium]